MALALLGAASNEDQSSKSLLSNTGVEARGRLREFLLLEAGVDLLSDTSSSNAAHSSATGTVLAGGDGLLAADSKNDHSSVAGGGADVSCAAGCTGVLNASQSSNAGACASCFFGSSFGEGTVGGGTGCAIGELCLVPGLDTWTFGTSTLTLGVCAGVPILLPAFTSFTGSGALPHPKLTVGLAIIPNLGDFIGTSLCVLA